MLHLIPPYTPTIIDETDLTAAVSESMDLGTLPVRLSVNAIVENSAANVGSFIDGVLASGTITITDYAAAHFTAATPSGTIDATVIAPGDTVIVTAAAVHTFTAVAAAPGTDEFVTAAELAALIGAVTGLDASNTLGTITITVTQKGTIPNSWTVTGTGTFVALSVTFSGGIDAAVVTVAGHALTESTDWNSVTNNNTAADNLAAAIDALSETQAANPAAAVITVKAAIVGTAGNSITTTKSGSGVTVQQATLAGGLANAIDGTAYTITIPAHGFSTGMKVNYDKLAGTTVANLVDNTDYFVIKVDADTIQLSATDGGIAIHVAAANTAVGGGSFTLTPTAVDADVTVAGSNDGANWITLDTDTLSATGNLLYEYPTASFRYIKVTVEPNDSEIDVRVVVHTKL